MPRLRVEPLPATVVEIQVPEVETTHLLEGPETVERLLTTGQELYARCPLHGLCGAFVALMSTGRGVVACNRCQRVLVEWKNND